MTAQKTAEAKNPLYLGGSSIDPPNIKNADDACRKPWKVDSTRLCRSKASRMDGMTFIFYYTIKSEKNQISGEKI